MNKQSFITILLTVFLSMVGEKTFAYDIAVAKGTEGSGTSAPFRK